MSHTAISRASGDTSRSGNGLASGDSSPANITATPASRSRVRHRHSHASPRLNTPSPQPGIGGTATVAAGQLATVRATHRIASIPHPIGTSATASSPSGISSSPATPSGITQNAVSGTATALAAMKYACTCPK